MLAGDSTAGQFSEPVIDAGRGLHYDVELATMSGCPLNEIRIQGAFASESACLAHDVATLHALHKASPAVLVISNQASEDIAGNPLAPISKGIFQSDPIHSQRTWGTGLRKLLRQLRAWKIRTLIVQPLPVFRAPPTECAVILVTTNNCTLATSRAAADAYSKLATSAQQDAVADVPDSQLLDLVNTVCDESRCSQVRHGTLLYRNRDHLSVPGARLVRDEFRNALLRALRP